MHASTLTLALCLAPLCLTNAQAAGDAARGETLYKSQCTACHSIDYNGVGPAHKGVYGRKAGSAAGYAYSAALASSSVVWADDTLARWLTNPESLIPGQKMGISVESADDRLDLIEFLKRAK